MKNSKLEYGGKEEWTKAEEFLDEIFKSRAFTISAIVILFSAILLLLFPPHEKMLEPRVGREVIIIDNYTFNITDKCDSPRAIKENDPEGCLAWTDSNKNIWIVGDNMSREQIYVECVHEILHNEITIHESQQPFMFEIQVGDVNMTYNLSCQANYPQLTDVEETVIGQIEDKVKIPTCDKLIERLRNG